MPLSSIAQVLLRLTALNWVLSGLIQAATYTLFHQGSQPSLLTFVSPIFLFVFGVGCWLVAPALSRQLAKGSDSHLALEGVSLRHLYATAFVGLGLYFALNSVSRVFSWLYFFAASPTENRNPVEGSALSFYNLSEPLITLLAGAFLIVTAGTWARRLAAKHLRELAEASEV